jgi:cytochrome c oxidase subunit 4
MTNDLKRTFRGLLGVWCVLLALLALTVGTAFIALGQWNGIINLAIAAGKAVIVAAFFMHLRRSPALLRITIAVPLVALAILVGLSATDFATRAHRGETAGTLHR